MQPSPQSPSVRELRVSAHPPRKKRSVPIKLNDNPLKSNKLMEWYDSFCVPVNTRNTPPDLVKYHNQADECLQFSRSLSTHGIATKPGSK